MNDIHFKCPQCQNSLAINDAGAGLRVNCPHCSQPITVPSKTPRKTTTPLTIGIALAVLVVIGGAAAFLARLRGFDPRARNLFGASC